LRLRLGTARATNRVSKWRVLGLVELYPVPFSLPCYFSGKITLDDFEYRQESVSL
jgi:hypothetical protein